MPDLTSLASAVAALLKVANQTVAVAESSGGGLISAALVSIPGASAYYIGGAVAAVVIDKDRLPGDPLQASRQLPHQRKNVLPFIEGRNHKRQV